MKSSMLRFVSIFLDVSSVHKFGYRRVFGLFKGACYMFLMSVFSLRLYGSYPVWWGRSAHLEVKVTSHGRFTIEIGSFIICLFYVWFFLFDSIWVSILLESCPIEMTSLNVTVLWMLLIFAIIFNCYVRHIFIRLCYFQKMLLLYLRLLTKIYDSKSLLETLSFYHSFFVSTLILIVVVLITRVRLADDNAGVVPRHFYYLFRLHFDSVKFLYLNLQPLLYMHITGCILLYEDLN